VNGSLKPHICEQINFQMDKSTVGRENESMPVGTVCDASKTTCFVEDESIVRESYPIREKLDPTEVRLTHIYDFLGKPLLINHGIWTGVAPGTPLFDFDIGPELTSNAIWADKIRGFSLIRATAVVRVMINANPFQAGMIYLHFLPCYAQIQAIDASYNLMHNNNLRTKYQQPHVEMTCRDTVMELKIPYIAPSTWYDLKVGAWDWGHVWLEVFSTLRVGAPATSLGVDYALYLHFEDVELAAPVVPQMDGGLVFQMDKKRVSRSKIKTRSGNEEEMKVEEGPISNALAIVASIADSFSSIPVIADMAKSVAWASRAAGGIASIFGWSKPECESGISPMTIQTFRYGANSDGQSLHYPLALIQDNKIRMSNQYTISNEDEMSFGFLKAIPHFATTVPWTTTTVSGGTPLYSIVYSPYQMILNNTTTGGTYGGHTVTYYTGAPWGLMCNDFAYWRGSVNLTIKIMKTDYHSGKLQISWIPGVVTTTPPDIFNGVFALREIVDIRYQSEITLNLPYLVYEPYLTQSQAMGRLDIIILNELRAPESAPSTVDLLIFFTAGDDFAYQGPGNSGLFGEPYVPQMDTEVLVSEGIAKSAIKSDHVEIADSTFGEVFTSIKLFLNRLTETYQGAIAAGGNGGQTLQVWPWYVGSVQQSTTTGGMLATIGGDAFSRYASFYAFYRGSARIIVASGSTASARVTASVVVPNPVATSVISGGTLDRGATNGQNSWITGNALYTGMSGITTTDDFSKLMPVRVPFYCPVPIAPVLTSYSITQSGSYTIPTISEVPQSSVTYHSSTSAEFTAYSIFRSFADDFQLCYFIGAPPRFGSTT
jgi:hypothetical protein